MSSRYWSPFKGYDANAEILSPKDLDESFELLWVQLVNKYRAKKEVPFFRQAVLSQVVDLDTVVFFIG